MLEERLDEDTTQEILAAVRGVQITDFSLEYLDEKLEDIDEELPEIIKELDGPIGIDYQSCADIWESYFESKTDSHYSGDEDNELDHDEKVAQAIKNFNYEHAQEHIRNAKFNNTFGILPIGVLVETEEDKMQTAYEDWKSKANISELWSFISYELA